MDDLEKYIAAHSAPEDSLLAELDRTTHLRTVHPQMISGHVQGRLLEMLVRMWRPPRVLEIGTFTGYSALCMAAGLGEGATLDTIEADDELEPIAREFFARSPHGHKIRLHIGRALDVAPRLAEELAGCEERDGERLRSIGRRPGRAALSPQPAPFDRESGPFDLLFIDGDKREYPDYLRMAMCDTPFSAPLVHSGSFILADNILWYGKVAAPDENGDSHTRAIAEFNDMVAADPRLENVIIPMRDGLNLIRVK